VAVNADATTKSIGVRRTEEGRKERLEKEECSRDAARVEERRRSTVTTSALMVYHRCHGRSRACDCEHARERG
jgi:hypothetical protein